MVTFAVVMVNENLVQPSFLFEHIDPLVFSITLHVIRSHRNNTKKY